MESQFFRGKRWGYQYARSYLGLTAKQQEEAAQAAAIEAKVPLFQVQDFKEGWNVGYAQGVARNKQEQEG